MNRRTPAPGVNRAERLSSDGLDRLDKQLGSGVNISIEVLAQWIRRYGDQARLIIRKHNKYLDEFDQL